MRSLWKLVCGVCLLAAAPLTSHAQKGAPADAALQKRYEKANLMPFYDAASDETSVNMIAMSLTNSADDGLAAVGLRVGAGLPPPPGVKFTVYFTYPGRTFVVPRQVTLRLASTSLGGPRFAGVEEVSVSIDGNTRSFGRAVITSRKYTSDIPKRDTEYVDEMLDISMPVEELNRLAAAKVVKLEVGGTSLTMKERHLKALRRVADAVGVAQ